MPLALAACSHGSFRATPAARSGLRAREFRLAIALAALTLACAPAIIRAEVGSGGCVVTHAVAVDSLAASGSRMLSVGRAIAQTFTPTDSLIRSVSIWTPTFLRSSTSWIHLWITQVSADGRPDLERVIADAGRLSGVGHDPARARYHAEFVPPISLPQRARYAVVVVAEGCGVLGVLTSNAGRPGVGDLWETSVRGCSGAPAATKQRFSGESLVFRVEFCDIGTTAQGRTWGEIKTLYR